MNGNFDYQQKMDRLAAGNKPRVIDLFSGCGGLSLGFHRAGFSILGGVEKDIKAAATHANNFFHGAPEEIISKHADPKDLNFFGPSEFMHEFCEAENPQNLVDVIIGGPPCQAFSRIGRAKLREIMKQPEAHLQDARASLYTIFLEYVEFFRPLSILMENVPDIMNFGGKDVAYEIASSLDEMGYSCRYAILNAANYGVPQYRMRFFLLAILKDLDIVPKFPVPTYRADVPAGYKNQTRGMKVSESAAAYLFSPSQLSNNFFIPAPTLSSLAQPNVTSQQALMDLPPITHHLDGRKHTGSRNFNTMSRYLCGADVSEFINEMRTWPGFDSQEGVWDHVIRYVPRDYEIFRRMSPGDEYPRAHQIASLEIFPEKLKDEEQSSGHKIEQGTPEYQRVWNSCVPPYDPTKFPNKWWKLIPDKPSRTLTAHMGKDTYSHIHYDSAQARVISVREAARLQSFPDGFTFSGSMDAAYRQIGNAVPPLIAFAFAKQIRTLIDKAMNNSVVAEIGEKKVPTITDL